jgi:hypothetical protein
MKRYTVRAAVHDTRVFYRLCLEYRWTIRNRRKGSHVGSHDMSDNQSRFTKARMGDVLYNKRETK